MDWNFIYQSYLIKFLQSKIRGWLKIGKNKLLILYSSSNHLLFLLQKKVKNKTYRLNVWIQLIIISYTLHRLYISNKFNTRSSIHIMRIWHIIYTSLIKKTWNSFSLKAAHPTPHRSKTYTILSSLNDGF